MKYKPGYKYVLAEDLTVKTKIKPDHSVAVDGNWVTLDTSGVLTIKKHYAWDGASGPAIDSKNIMRGALIHDALYQLMREGGLDPKWFAAANDELHAACIEDGMSWFRAWYVHRAVSLFGARFAQPKTEEIKEAP